MLLSRAFLAIGISFSLAFMAGVYTGILFNDGEYGGLDSKFFQAGTFSLIPAAVGWFGYGWRKGAFKGW